MRDVDIEKVETLSSGWISLKKYTIGYTSRTGERKHIAREVHDHGDGAAVLPYDPARGTVLLVRQFRLPAYLRGDREPLIEAAAGLLDGDDPETCAKREAEEELGFRLKALDRVTRTYLSPGSNTERLTLFLAEYTCADRVSAGGGKESENEEIEILEMPFAEAWSLMTSGVISDAKTIILLLHLRLRLGD
jgi:nudix-type nucleoside diphosphatase (YffH/AdpP family)